jgi:hypothetical protein
MGNLSTIFRSLPAGQRRALLALSREWSFPSRAGYDGNAASRLAGHYPPLAESDEVRGPGIRYTRCRYRITAIGERVRGAWHG